MSADSLNSLLLRLHQKARQIGKQCKLEAENLKKETQAQQIISSSLRILDSVKEVIDNLWSTSEDYNKLEQMVQKHEQDIRKHIGIEQQLKLYGDSLQQQLDESEKSRKTLLEETRKMLVSLKRENQRLHAENQELRQQIRDKQFELVSSTKQESSSKKKHRKTNSIEDVSRPLKTQYHQKRHNANERTPRQSTRKNNLSANSKKKEVSKGPSKKDKSSIKKLPMKKPPQLKDKSQKVFTFQDVMFKSTDKPIPQRKRINTKASGRKSAGLKEHRHFQSHEHQARYQL